MRRSSQTEELPQLFIPDFKHPSPGCSIRRVFLGGHSFFLGGRYKTYHFPRRLVEKCVRKINSRRFRLPKTSNNTHAALHALRPIPGLPMPERLNIVASMALPQEPSHFRRGAQGMAVAMTDTMFTSAVHEWFDPDLLVVTRDKPLLPPETSELCDSLRDHIRILQVKVPGWLKELMAELYRRFPDASTAQLYEAAVKLISDQLRPLLATVQMWTTGFRQWLNPELQPKLKLIRAMIEQKLFLVLTGNLKLDQVEDAAQIKQQVPTIKVSVADVIIPVLIGPFDSGPAVIPMTGAVGPRGGHLVFYPANFLDNIALNDKPFDHEAGHLIMSVIVGFAPEFAQMTTDAIDQALALGKLKFKTDFVQWGKRKYKTVDFVKMVLLNQLPELIADLFGCLIGGAPSFTKAYSTYIGSMISMVVGGLDRVEKVIGNASSYRVEEGKDGTRTLIIEAHPQDLVRIGAWQPAIARQTQFEKTADYLEGLVSIEGGKPLPEVIVWHAQKQEGEGEDNRESLRAKKTTRRASKTSKAAAKTPPALELLVADYSAAAEIVADYLLNTQAVCLNGMTLKQLVCLTPEMFKNKIVPLKDLLKQGIGKLPADGRHYFLHLITSAAILAYLELVAEGVDPAQAIKTVSEAGEKMMNEALGPWEEMKRKNGIYDLPAKQLQPVCTYKKPGCDGSCEEEGGHCPDERQPPKVAARKTRKKTR